MNHSDIAALMKGAAPVIRDYVAAAVQPLFDHIEMLTAEIGRLKSMPAPRDGKDADPDAVAAIVAERIRPELKELRAAVEALPPAPELPDVAGMIADAVKALPEPPSLPNIPSLVAEAVSALPAPQDGKDADPALMAQQVKEAAEAILAGWERPQDGKSVTVEELEPIIEERVQKAVAAIPMSKDGKDGHPGKDGRDALDAVEFLRSADGNLIVTLSNGTTKDLGPINGKDGKPGKDGDPGRDGFGFDDLELVENAKGVFLSFKRGEDVKEFRLPIVIDRGVFKEATYQRGDGVSFGGSFWIAQEETANKPGEGNGWRLAVKRGRDGKDGTMKAPPKSGPVKVG